MFFQTTLRQNNSFLLETLMLKKNSKYIIKKACKHEVYSYQQHLEYVALDTNQLGRDC